MDLAKNSFYALIYYMSPLSFQFRPIPLDQHTFPYIEGGGSPPTPLSALAIEPLAIALCFLEGCDGVSRGEGEHKTLLYAND